MKPPPPSVPCSVPSEHSPLVSMSACFNRWVSNEFPGGVLWRRILWTRLMWFGSQSAAHLVPDSQIQTTQTLGGRNSMTFEGRGNAGVCPREPFAERCLLRLCGDPEAPPPPADTDWTAALKITTSHGPVCAHPLAPSPTSYFIGSCATIVFFVRFREGRKYPPGSFGSRFFFIARSQISCFRAIPNRHAIFSPRISHTRNISKS